jgi:hypothetical protein
MMKNVSMASSVQDSGVCSDDVVSCSDPSLDTKSFRFRMFSYLSMKESKELVDLRERHSAMIVECSETEDELLSIPTSDSLSSHA